MTLLKITFDLDEEIYGYRGSLDSAMIEFVFQRGKTKEIEQVSGLKWEHWAIQRNECSVAGFFLFQTSADAEAHAEFVKKHFTKGPGLSFVDAEFFDALDGLSRLIERQ